MPYVRAWCVGERRAELERLINAYKFENLRVAYRTLAALLDESLPQLPGTTVVVPVPTIAAHVRQRGYDHVALVAKEFARRRSLPYRSSLQRQSMSVQRGKTRQERTNQAKTAFSCAAGTLSGKTCLLIDDVVTTGATLRYGAQTLLNADTSEVWVAAICRQPLD